MNYPGRDVCQALKEIKEHVPNLRLTPGEKEKIIAALEKLLEAYNCI
jgi:hypothetical protein